ncbi:rhodanese-like domain-containing protein, partial [Patescibacteria group bacterium]
MRNIIIFVLVVGALGLGFLYWSSIQTPEVVSEEGTFEINVAEINQEVTSGEAVLLDVRTDQELIDNGYALGSTHFDVVRIDAGELPDISKELKVYTYCKVG